MNKIEVLITIITGVIIPIGLFFASKKWRRKKYLLSKFYDNKRRISKLASEMRTLLSEYNAWNSILFKDGNITYREYLETLEEKANLEYSDEQFKALKKKKLSTYEKDEYIQKLKVQEDNINLMQAQLDVVKKQMSIRQ